VKIKTIFCLKYSHTNILNVETRTDSEMVKISMNFNGRLSFN